MILENCFDKGVEQIARKIRLEDFFAIAESEKIPFLNNSEGSLFHLVASQQLDRDILDLFYRVADKARSINKTEQGLLFLRSLLFGKKALLLFPQPSTRTFLSFWDATTILGMDVVDVRDPKTSSEVKGESLSDSIRTNSSYFDIIIMRHPKERAVEEAIWALNKSFRRIPIINAGSGPDQHPTQAILDMYTLYKSFDGQIDGRTIAMVGDLKRGRTVRSLSYLMRNYQDMKLIFVSPPELKMEDDIKDFLNRHNVFYYERDDLEEVVGLADAIYMTRAQDEYGEKGRESVDERFKFKKEYLDLMKEDAILMHPLPKREEIDPEIDNIDDNRIIYWRQPRNGMWIRVALIATIFQKEQEILDYKI